MNDIPINIQYSVGLMVVIGIVLYLTVDKRFKERIISEKTRNTQIVEIVLLVVSVSFTDFMQLVLKALSNKFVLNGIEIALIVLFLLIDKLINKKESFLG